MQDPEQQARAAVEFLEAVAAERGILTAIDTELRLRLLRAAGLVSRPSRTELRLFRRAERKEKKKRTRDADDQVLDTTTIRRKRAAPIFATPSRDAPRELEAEAQMPAAAPTELKNARSCYVCKVSFTRLHHFYDKLCTECAELNFRRREQTCDLHGRTALITGARVKIGYQAAIKLLRAGARVLVTTRFPNDAARRYSAEDDFDQWGDRLAIHGLDLRHTPSVQQFCRDLLAQESRLDFIINNACQTVRRPAGFYGHLMEAERQPELLSAEALALVARPGADALSPARSDMLASGSTVLSAELTQIPLLPEDEDTSVQIFPKGQLDADEQQVDHRKVNSWRLLLDEVPAVELLEVHLVNAVAPFILNGELKALMMRTPERDKHIVNVSAMEGQFYRTFKTPRHPHTNMAKAGLNMLTRTSAPDYVRDGIHMNSVDTGWVTDEDPSEIAARKREAGFHPPLDIVDGAARIVDPIIQGQLTGEHVWGRFLKDYAPTDW